MGQRTEQRSLRVLLAPSTYYPRVGGIEELTRQLALALKAKGHEASVLTNRWTDDLVESELLDRVDVTRLRFPLPAAHPRVTARFMIEAPGAARAVARQVRRWQADVVHVIGGGPQAVYLGFLVRRLGVRLVFTTQGEIDAKEALQVPAALRLGLRHVVRTADVVTTCSAHTLRSLETFVTPACPSLVIPNGVDPEEFDGGYGRKTGLEPYVFAIGRLVPPKGFDVLIDAFAAAELADLNLVIAGDGPEREALVRRAAAKGVADRFYLTGVVDRSRLSAWLHGAEAFAFPSRQEPFGIALLEAMAAGTPAVATAAGGVTEFARDGENALLVPPEQPSALAAALARVVVDPSLRSRLSTGGRRTALELAWTRIAERYQDVYAQARGADIP